MTCSTLTLAPSLISDAVHGSLTDELLQPKWRKLRQSVIDSGRAVDPTWGHCYAAAESVFHMLGGADAGWRPENLTVNGYQHWYVRHRTTGEIVDPTAAQFTGPIPYEQGRGRGFLTRQPSKRAQLIIDRARVVLAS